MHELGIVLQVVERIETVAREQGLSEIESLTLQIGELSSMIPRYVEACYPMAVEGTLLEKTELKIEVMPGNGRCKACGQVYNLLEENNTCPTCQGQAFDVLSGKEFNIKEIVAC